MHHWEGKVNAALTTEHGQRSNWHFANMTEFPRISRLSRQIVEGIFNSEDEFGLLAEFGENRTGCICDSGLPEILS